jgi:hypothetical protein
MRRCRILFLVLIPIAFKLVSIPVAAQTGADSATPVPQPAHVRKAAIRPMPFPPDGSARTAQALEFRSLDRMTAEDRDLALSSQPSIGQRAAVFGLELGLGAWSYQQIVCPALPGHLLLQFTRNSGNGDVSVFSASVPRSGDGRVRVIPVSRRGYSLFSPAPVNSQTIAAFNQIRAEEHPDTAPEWLDTGLCYAALAGAHAEIGPAEETRVNKLPAAPVGTITIPMNGGAVISFVDGAAIPRPMEWTMRFDGKGKLLKATHSRPATSRAKAAQRKPAEVQAKSVKTADADDKATLYK